MASKTLARGMGTFLKKCDCAKPTRCPHHYTIRFRNPAGRQAEESGFQTQQDAIDRLTEIYNRKRSGTPQAASQEALDLSQKRFKEYAEDYVGRRRDWGVSRNAGARSSLTKHLYPELGSRRMETFSPTVVENFITTMERNDVGLGAQEQVFMTLKKILLNAHSRGAIPVHPLQDVIPPQYEPDRAVVPDFETIQALKSASTDPRF